jgi:protein tyrosine phosphatase (PTP) superfamily phosphohydrolase (DUF442 family)
MRQAAKQNSTVLSATALLAGLVGGACHSAQEKEPPPFAPLESSELGTMHNVSVSDGLWFGGKPTIEDLDLARRRGIERIIAITTPGDLGDLDLQLACESLGLKECVSIEVPADQPLSPEAVDQVMGLLGETPRPRTLLFCRDGSVSAMLFAIHRRVNEEMPLEQAIAEARRSGMRTGPESETFVRDQVLRLGTREGE